MDAATAVLIGVVAAVAAIAATLTMMTRRGVTFTTDRDSDGRGPPTRLVDIEEDVEDRAYGELRQQIYRVFESTQLLNAGHLRGMDVIEHLMHHLAEAVMETGRSHRRRPRRPTSILLHGPPGGAMIILVHTLARRFHARLVQVYASRSVPLTNGGSQPAISAAVNEARYHLPSVLVIDEFETVAATGIKDVEKQRAANDLMAESLRPIYGASHLVVATFVAYDNAPVPRTFVNVFEHTVYVAVPELERTLMMIALRTADSDLFRTISGTRLAERGDVTRSWDSAA